VIASRHALLLIGIASAAAACTANLDQSSSGYAEGEVTVAANNEVTVGKVDMSAVLRPSVTESLKNFDGLDVAVAYSASRTDILSPVDDTWRAFAEAVNVPPDVDPRLKPSWTGGTSVRTTFPDQLRLARLASSFRSVDNRYQQFAAAANRPSDHDLHGLVNDYKSLVLSAFDSAEAAQDSAQKQLLINLAVDSQTKLQGGMLMSYEAGLRRPPQFYRNVGLDAGGTVAITRLTSVIGTGFLVSREWVITNRHVVAGILDLRTSTLVEFDREEPASTTAIADRSCEIVDERIVDSKLSLDLAAIKFRCRPNFPPSWEGRLLHLARRETVLNEGVYVVGHPFSGSKQVVDNAFVRYPHRVSNSAHTGLRQLISSASDQALFDRFYQKCTATTSDWCYRSSPDRWGGTDSTANIPTVGFDSNTAPGNSGSPVMSASDNTVVGVFFGGSRDYAVQGPWSFGRHEAAIPSTSIVDWLKSVGVTVP
jgi:hypothetical protein